jgi:hypothetical protein
MRHLFLLFISLVLLLFACKNKPDSPMIKTTEAVDLPKDFLSFYQQFHTDSAYQISHIQWPLKGEKAERTADGRPLKVLTTWEVNTWEMLHLPDLKDPGLKRKYETISDVMVIERLQYPMVNFGLERQFYKDENNQWNLIFYSEMQELR